MNTSRPRLEIKAVSKSFSGVRALTDVSIDIGPGEIHSICGENGAGKSTLMKILSGAYQPDAGSIVVDGVEYGSLDPFLAQDLGINIIYQENLLVPTMSVLENMFIGREPTRGGVLMDFAAMRARMKEELDFLGISLDPSRRIETLSVAEQQFVKILKALVLKPQVLIMDEPTSMFNTEDAGRVIRMVRRISEAGISVIYISHFLEEVRAISDRITVIRDGQVVSTRTNSPVKVDLAQITNDMVGRPIEMFYAKEEHAIGDVVLAVDDLRLTPGSPGVSFTVREGEILGIAGMVGSGRTEIVRAVGGADRFYSGTIRYRDKRLTLGSPRRAINAGIGHITEDRQRLGLMLNQSISENATVVNLEKLSSSWILSLKKLKAVVLPVIDKLRVKRSSLSQEVRYLSGGNQQKVVLAKWLLADSSLLIFDEPTRGIDVNAKAEFYKLMSELTRAGKSIIMVSSDMPELVSMSDRVLVMRAGSIVAEIPKSDISEQAIIAPALEGTRA